MRAMFAVRKMTSLYDSDWMTDHPLLKAFVPSTSVTFVSKASVKTGTVSTYNLRKRIESVKNCRNIGKRDMKYNDSMPKMKVDPETYVSETGYSYD